MVVVLIKCQKSILYLFVLTKILSIPETIVALMGGVLLPTSSDCGHSAMTAYTKLCYCFEERKIPCPLHFFRATTLVNDRQHLMDLNINVVSMFSSVYVEQHCPPVAEIFITWVFSSWLFINRHFHTFRSQRASTVWVSGEDRMGQWRQPIGFRPFSGVWLFVHVEIKDLSDLCGQSNSALETVRFNIEPAFYHCR